MPAATATEDKVMMPVVAGLYAYATGVTTGDGANGTDDLGHRLAGNIDQRSFV